MTTQHDLVALALRVESGGGSDRELDAGVCVALGWIGAHPQGFDGPALNVSVSDDPYFEDTPWEDLTFENDEGEVWETGTPPITASLDDVVALIEEKLPDAAWLVARQGKPDGFFVHAGVGQAQCNSITAPGVTPARALLAAALRAMKEEGR